MEVRNTPEVQEMELLLLQNATLLGFDAREVEKHHRLQVVPSMFRKMNIKGTEIILHFLLSAIEPHYASEIFKHVWPIYDKNQARDFAKICQVYIQQLEKTGKIPHISKPLFYQGRGGEKFIEFLWILSIYAIQCSLSREKKTSNTDRKTFTPHLPDITTLFSKKAHSCELAKRVAQTHIIMQSRMFTEQLRRTKGMKKEWQSWIDARISEYQEIVRALAAQRQEQRKFETEVDAGLFEETQVIKRQKSLETIRSFYRLIDNFMRSTSKTRQLVDDIMNGRPNLNRLERDMVAYSVPSILMDYMKGIDIEEEDIHHLSVTNLLRTWKVSVTLMSRFLAELEKSGGLQKLCNMAEAVSASSSSCEQYYESQKGLLADVGQDIRELKQSITRFTIEIERLSDMHSEKDEQITAIPSATPSRPQRKYGLVPPTPQMQTDTAVEQESEFGMVSYGRNATDFANEATRTTKSLINSIHLSTTQTAEPKRFLQDDADSIDLESNSRRQLQFNPTNVRDSSCSTNEFEMSPPREFPMFRESHDDPFNTRPNSSSKVSARKDLTSSQSPSVRSSVSSVSTSATRKSSDGLISKSQRPHSPKRTPTNSRTSTGRISANMSPSATVNEKPRLPSSYRANVLSSLEGNPAARKPSTSQPLIRSSSSSIARRDDIRLEDYDDASLVNLSLSSRHSWRKEAS